METQNLSEEQLREWLSAAQCPPITSVYCPKADNHFFVSFEREFTEEHRTRLGGLGFTRIERQERLKNNWLLVWQPTDEDLYDEYPDFDDSRGEVCFRCNGTGIEWDGPFNCPRCHGMGYDWWV